MEKLFTETEIRRKLSRLNITNPDIFFDDMQPHESDDKDKLQLLQTSAIILAGILANDGVSNSDKDYQITVSLQYTQLLMQKIDTYDK